MICRNIGKWLADQAAGRLSGPEETELLTHLAGCSECRSQAGLFQKSLVDLAQAFRGPGPLDLSGRIIHLASGLHAAPVFGRWLLALAEVAVVALMALWPKVAF